ncbi:hypothetical protein [Haladaptatus sp. ZSTT2]|uniref:hypothetical protein n=1 Tax=Haladaptatus sp. ZSTT2 TaxID=3120515 RepID=UPI00300EAC30
MPITPLDLQRRALIQPVHTREEPDVPFDELLYMLAEGVTEAQTKLDLSTAELLAVLSETRVDVVPQLTRTLAVDGTMTTEAEEPVSRSLLELGFEPTRYQFSEATVEAEFDISIAETSETDREEEGRLVGLRAGTYELNHQRTFNREVSANARFTARLQPVPLPLAFTPTEETDVDEQ